LDRPPSVERFDLDEFGPLAKANGLNPNVFNALSLGLPARLPIPGEVNSMDNRPSGQLVERDTKDAGNRHGDGECGIRLACLVSPDLALVDAGGFGKLRLRESTAQRKAEESPRARNTCG
jgi:hypothetical protein